MESDREVVGRRVELNELADFLRRLEDGPAVLVLSGPAGIGKTTLWRRGVDLAEAAGCAVLSAWPSGAEGRLSFAGLSDLLAPVDLASVEGLPPVQRRALDVALLRGAQGGAGVDARAVATGLLSVLLQLASASPVLVAVDDAQWLDAATTAALRFALRRLGGARVGVLASTRVEDGRPETFVDAVPAERRTEVVVAPLSVAAIHEVLQLRLGRSLPRPTLVKVVTASGGNPFYAIEIARELIRLGEIAPGAGLPIPGEMQMLVRARLARLPRPTRDALLMASCLSVPRTPVIAEEPLAPAEEAGLVRIAGDGRIRFVHPLVAAAVYESAAAARRRAAHRELAVRISDPEERARHLALGSERPDAEAAARLDEAARLARARGAPEVAAELVELALHLAPETEARAERLLTAAGLHFEAGDPARAQALLEQALEGLPGGPLRARALRLLGQLHGRRSSFEDALRLAVAALDEAAGDAMLTAGLQLDAAFYQFSLGDPAGAEPYARAAVASAEQAGADALLANALAVRAVVGFLCGRGTAEADMARALALEDRSRPVPLMLDTRFIHGLLLLWKGLADEALATLDAVRVEALEQGRESEAPFVFLYLVWACLWRGELERASDLADQARRTASLLDDRAANALALSAAALADAFGGRPEAARAEAEQAIGLFAQLGWLSGTIWASWALGFLELSLGDPAAADAVLGPPAGMVASLESADPALGVFLPDEIEALVELGRTEDARTLLESFEARARAVERGWALAAAARCRGLLQAAAGDLDAALAALDEALERHGSLEMPFERARTLLELGRVQRRRKQKRLARLALEESVAAFDALGAPLWAARGRAELARVTTRRAARGLTATEERIARLAAEGLTNREISERAFVSVNTVEANLTRVYRKLGISSRAQLSRALEALASQPIP